MNDEAKRQERSATEIADIVQKALEQSGDWAEFCHWTPERLEQCLGRKEEGWIYLNGPLNINAFCVALRKEGLL